MLKHNLKKSGPVRSKHAYLLKVADKLTKIYGSRMYNYYDEQCFQNYEGN